MTKKIIIIILVASFGLFLSIRPYYLFLTQTLKISPVKTLFSSDSLKTYKDQVNVLILGIAGENHDGPNLSDSIIVANYDIKNNQMTTVSIPRDIWSDTLKDKINSAYAYGEAKQKGGGLKLAKAEVSAIIGQPIQYAAVIDFDKFKTLIDYLGGLDVEVSRSFTDKEFPIAGKENNLCNGDPEYRCRYETISFSKGLTHMDGETALKYVRSRHAQDSEGSDFARGQRQQEVIKALKNKVVDIVKTGRLNEISGLYQELNKLIGRDITNQQVAIVAKNIFLKKDFQQKQISLTDDFFIVPQYYLYDGKYVLIPESGDFETIHEYINCHIENKKNCEPLKKESKEN
ncbi:LCP family protein [Candidatus Roizmanbacteria bacterium]|jgi:LCP family protein required for cell wall assembly|nr:LCP family protein [Candidatus Roizmanbacteria bacterium]